MIVFVRVKNKREFRIIKIWEYKSLSFFPTMDALKDGELGQNPSRIEVRLG